MKTNIGFQLYRALVIGAAIVVALIIIWSAASNGWR